MSVTVAPTQSQAFSALRAFLLQILPSGVPVYQTQDNRVAEPVDSDFVMMTPMRRDRIETNIDTSADVFYTGSISGVSMVVTDVAYGKITPGAPIFGVGVADNSSVVSGPSEGGVGTYVITPSQTVASEPLASGAMLLTQPTKLTVQLDVYGPNSGDNAQTISTAFRDQYATEAFDTMPTYGGIVSPLYADDPRQSPFVDDQSQYEKRWIIEAVMQVNPVVTVPQQYADALSVVLKEIDATFPP